MSEAAGQPARCLGGAKGTAFTDAAHSTPAPALAVVVHDARSAGSVSDPPVIRALPVPGTMRGFGNANVAADTGGQDPALREDQTVRDFVDM